jgi:hypothetical protein
MVRLSSQATSNKQQAYAASGCKCCRITPPQPTSRGSIAMRPQPHEQNHKPHPRFRRLQ